jgi:hypothetical protein
MAPARWTLRGACQMEVARCLPGGRPAHDVVPDGVRRHNQRADDVFRAAGESADASHGAAAVARSAGAGRCGLAASRSVSGCRGGGLVLAAQRGFLRLSVPLLRFSVPLLRSFVPLLRFSVPLLRLSVPLLRFSVPLLPLSVPFLGVSGAASCVGSVHRRSSTCSDWIGATRAREVWRCALGL